MSLNNFGAGASITKKLLQTTCRQTVVITRIQLLEGPPPKIWEGQKNVQISARFLTTFNFEREYLRNGSTYRTSGTKFDQPVPLPRWPKKFGELWSTTKKDLLALSQLIFFGCGPKWLILTNPREHFSGDYISVIRGCCAMKFLNALQIDQVNLAHTPTGTGSPRKKI